MRDQLVRHLPAAPYPDGPTHDHAVGPFVELLVLALAVAAVLFYLVAARHPRRGGAWPATRSLAWVAGVVVAAASVVGPVADSSHTDLRWHMLGHLMLGMAAPLLLVLAAPVTLALRSLELTPARRLSRLLRSGPVRVVSHPIAAAVLSVGGAWALYATPVFAAAEANRTLMALVMLHVFASGYLFTASIVGVDPDPHRADAGMRMAVLLVAIAAHAVLAKYLYANPPSGLPGAAPAAELMYYGGDVVHVMMLVVLVSTARRALGRSAQRRAIAVQETGGSVTVS